MSGKISPPSTGLGDSEKRLSIILVVVFVTVIIVCICIHCFLRRQRRLALETNKAGEGGLESSAIAESDIPLINVRDSVLDRIAGLPGTLRAPDTVAQTKEPVTPPARNVTPASGPNALGIAKPAETLQKRVSFATLPITPRRQGINGNVHPSGLTDFAVALETRPCTSNGATDPGCVAHNPSTHIDLDDGFGPYRFPPLSTSPSLLSPMEIDAPPETSLSANSKKRYSTIPAAAIEAARSSAPAASGSASKRNSTIKVVGQPDPESPGSEAAKLGGRVVQQKVSGNWVVYDYTPTKSPADGDAK